MKRTILGLLLIAFTHVYLSAQTDTLICYDLMNQSYDTIFPLGFNETDSFDHTMSHTGSLGATATLSLTPPADSLFSGSQFSWPQYTNLFYDVENYPMRTTCKLIRYKNDTLSTGSSVNLVGASLAIGNVHVIYDFFNKSWKFDSIFVSPAYDLGMPNTNFPLTRVNKVYYNLSMDSTLINDLCLYELESPLGTELGWIGIGYSLDDSWFEDKVFHKFSYPKGYAHTDTATTYDGNNQMYNFGYIDVFDERYLGISSQEAWGIPGQSGSCFLYTDNNDYFTIGQAEFAGGYVHERFLPKTYYAFKEIIESHLNTIEVTNDITNELTVYPNPCNNSLKIKGLADNRSMTQITIFNSMGQCMFSQNLNGNYSDISVNKLEPGMYFISIENNYQKETMKFIVQK